LAVPLDPAGRFRRQRAEGRDPLPGRVKPADVEDEGGEDGRGNGPDAGDGVEVVRTREGSPGGHEQRFQAFLPGLDGAEVADPVADQFLRGRAGERADRGPRVVEQRGA
jgi:hypothetical protein